MGWKTKGFIDGYRAGIRIKGISSLEDASRIIIKLRKVYVVDMRLVLAEKLSDQQRYENAARIYKHVGQYMERGLRQVLAYIDSLSDIGPETAQAIEIARQTANRLANTGNTDLNLWETLFRNLLHANGAIHRAIEKRGKYSLAEYNPKSRSWSVSQQLLQLQDVYVEVFTESKKKRNVLFAVLEKPDSFILYVLNGKAISEKQARTILDA